MDFKAKPFIHMVFLCLLFVGAYGLVSKVDENYACAAAGAAAGAAPTTPCDPEYMDALEARAWLEAQREIAQNQNLIVKPDSVLEYTCFDRFLLEIADDAVNQFSETTRWGTIPGLESTTQDAALGRLILTGLTSYITENFPHTFLGGRSTLDHVMTTNPQAGGNYTYTCDRMRVVWEAAKCMNFFNRATANGAVTENHDGFYDFRWYNTNDPRQLPTGNQFAACSPPGVTPPSGIPPVPPAGVYTFEQMEAISFNTRQNMYVLTPENPNNATAYNRDNLVTFLNFILPVGVAPATACITQPIQTGIRINRRMTNAPYDDGVCPNPGCYLGAGGTQCQ